jgi:hypothetical protein
MKTKENSGAPDLERDLVKRIYEMKLHETEEVSDYLQIIRLPGGWIYNFKRGSEVFVPFDDEFMPMTPTEVRQQRERLATASRIVDDYLNSK